MIGSTGRTAGTSYERRKACCPSRVAPTYPAVEALCGIMLSLSAFLGIGVWSSAKTTGFGGDSVFRSGAPEEIRTAAPDARKDFSGCTVESSRLPVALDKVTAPVAGPGPSLSRLHSSRK